MSNQLLPWEQNTQAAAQWLFDEAAGGICISGDSGSGKSVLLRHIMKVARSSGSAVFLFDPLGGLAKAVLRDCLAGPKTLRERLYYFAPDDHTIPVGPLNPLFVDVPPNDLLYASKVSTKAMHTALQFLAAYGEADFDGKPQLFRWLSFTMRAVGLLGLSIADARYFLQPDSEICKSLISRLPDPILRGEFETLSTMRPGEREDTFASTKARLIRLLETSEVLRAHLSVPQQAIRIRELIEQRAVVIVDLHQRDNSIHPEDMPILANLWLSEILFTVYGTPEEQRIPTLIACDELSVFRPSTMLIARALRQIRQLRTRFIGAFQGLAAFTELQEKDPLFQAMGQCNVHFYFKHKRFEDADYFGKFLTLPEYDAKEVKYEQIDYQQYVAGSEIRQSIDRSFQESFAKGAQVGTTTGTVATAGTMAGQSSTESHKTGLGSGETIGSQRKPDGTPGSSSDGRSRHQTEEHSSGTQLQASNSESLAQQDLKSTSSTEQKTNGQGITHKQSWSPVYDWQPIISKLQYYTREELEAIKAKDIAALLVLEAFLYVGSNREQGPRIGNVTLNILSNPYDDAPKTYDKLRLDFLHRLAERPFCHNLHDLLLQMQQRGDVLLNRQQPTGRVLLPPQLPLGHDDGPLSI